MTKESVYQSVTDRIVTAIEEGGIAPWRKPWAGGGPVQIRNDRPYRGINIFLLSLASYGDPRWGTFKAMKEAAVRHAKSEGRTIFEKTMKRGRYTVTKYFEEIDGVDHFFRGGVREGEHGTSIILWKPVKKKGEIPEGEDDSYLLLKSYSVFNAEQCDEMPPMPEAREHEPIEMAERIANGYVGPTVDFGGDRACYSPPLDFVKIPIPANFVSAEAYYSTLYHELVHSTGHETRLDRLESTQFGSGPYAKEELVAEMGAAMLCGMAGIDNLDESASYVSGWLEKLKGDPKLVVQAAALANKAADLVLGVQFESDSQDPEKVAVAA
jgi:antirestriction protein ArdC